MFTQSSRLNFQDGFDPIVFNSFGDQALQSSAIDGDCIGLSTRDIGNWFATNCNLASKIFCCYMNLSYLSQFTSTCFNVGFGGTPTLRPICKQEQTTTTTSESMDALSDIFDFLMEIAPVATAVGGVAASTALVANPSLPMTGSNGVPPGIYTY